MGRKDDIIISSGHRIGPVEVESSILRHPAVEEVAVVASPDEIRGNIVKAFVKLKSGCKPSANIIREIQELVEEDVALYAYPRAIEFIDTIPKSVTGKIKRERKTPRTRITKKNVEPGVRVWSGYLNHLACFTLSTVISCSLPQL